MSHKAGPEFFESKREWSVYKDTVLDYYLVPYLQKVKTLQKPIRLYDLYAGPGRFDDGEPGSPIIILERAVKISRAGFDIHVVLVEQDPKLASRLRANTQEYGDLCTVIEGGCEDCFDRLVQEAKDKTVFAYIDPFSISRLHLGQLGQLYDHISAGGSVEVLFVFMADAFLRWAASSLQAEEIAGDVLFDKAVMGEDGTEFSLMMAEALWDVESIRMAKFATNSKEALDGIAGGNYWRKYASSGDVEYADRLHALVDEYCEKLRQWFRVVLRFPIFGGDSSTIPKYWMLFGSRYLPAIDLMNLAMAKARQKQLDTWKKNTLFANVELPLEMTQHDLRRVLKESLADRPVSWQTLRYEISNSYTGMFTGTQIDNAIKELLGQRQILGTSGTKVVQDAVLALVEPGRP